MSRFLGIMLLSASLMNGSVFASGSIAQQAGQMVKGAGKYIATLGTAAVIICSTMTGCDEAVDIIAGLTPGDTKEPVEPVEPVDPVDVVTDTVIRIGMNYDARFDINAYTGAWLAVDEINAAGGIDGMQIELHERDNKKDVDQSLSLTNELINKVMVHGLVGPEYSSHAIAVGPIAQENRIPMVTTTATNPIVTAAGEYVFMAAFTDAFQGELMAKFAVNEFNASAAAVITEEGDAYSEGLSQTFIDSFNTLGGTVVTQQFYPADATDFSSQLAAVHEKAPEVIFVPGFVPEVALVVKQGREMGITANFIGADGWGNADLLKFGGDALEGTFFSNHFYTKPEVGLSDRTINFINDHIEVWGERPISRSALGYDAVYLIAEAIDRADSLSGAEIIKELAATRNFDGATYIVGFNNRRHARKNAVIETVRDGGTVFYTLVSP